jgi:hypothetical protein
VSNAEQIERCREIIAAHRGGLVELRDDLVEAYADACQDEPAAMAFMKGATLAVAGVLG